MNLNKNLMPSEDMPKQYIALLAVVILFGVFTRAYRLGDKVLWVDEGINWKLTQGSTSETMEYFRLEQHSPLPQLIDNFWVRQVGDSVMALHAEPLIWSVLTLLVFTFTVIEFFPWKVAVSATIIFSLNALVPEFAQTFRYPAFSGFTAAVWFYALMSYLRKGGVLRLAFYAVALAAFVHTHLYMSFVVFSLFAFVLAFRKTLKGKVAPLLCAQGIAFASIVPKIMQILSVGVSEKAPAVPMAEVVTHLKTIPIGCFVKLFYNFFAGQYIEPENLPALALAFLLVTFGVIAIAGFINKERKFEMWLSTIIIVGAAAQVWLVMVLRRAPFGGRYFIPHAMFFCLILGIGVERIWRWKPKLAGLTLIFISLTSLCFLNHYWRNIDRPENYKTAMEYITTNALAGDFVNISPPYTPLFEYYWKGTPPANIFFGDYEISNALHNNTFYINSGEYQIREEQMNRWHKTIAVKYNRLWMLWPLGAINTEDRAGVAVKWLDAHYERVETRPFRLFPYSETYTGEVVLYRVVP